MLSKFSPLSSKLMSAHPATFLWSGLLKFLQDKSSNDREKFSLLISKLLVREDPSEHLESLDSVL